MTTPTGGGVEQAGEVAAVYPCCSHCGGRDPSGHLVPCIHNDCCGAIAETSALGVTQ